MSLFAAPFLNERALGTVIVILSNYFKQMTNNFCLIFKLINNYICSLQLR